LRFVDLFCKLVDWFRLLINRFMLLINRFMLLINRFMLLINWFWLFEFVEMNWFSCCVNRLYMRASKVRMCLEVLRVYAGIRKTRILIP